MLHEFVSTHRDEIIRRCRMKVAARTTPAPTPAEIEHGVPLFLDQLVRALQLGHSGSADIDETSLLHGQDLLAQGLSMSQVVQDYGDVCQSITELAVETSARIGTDEFRMLNGCLDRAIAGAVTEYGRQRQEAAVSDATSTGRETEQLGFLAHELRDLIHTVMIAFDVVKSGHVGAGGSTSRIIDRSLQRARDLITRSLAEVRLSEGVEQLEDIAMPELIDDLMTGARLEANVRGIQVALDGDGHGAAINADRQILTTAVMNLVQNALKFSRVGSTVTLRVRATAHRVLVEVQDQCGGLAGVSGEELFRPFEQRGNNRSGLGLGLTFARTAIEAIGGTITVSDLPQIGCVFCVDLPRVPMAVKAPAAALALT